MSGDYLICARCGNKDQFYKEYDYKEETIYHINEYINGRGATTRSDKPIKINEDSQIFDDSIEFNCSNCDGGSVEMFCSQSARTEFERDHTDDEGKWSEEELADEYKNPDVTKRYIKEKLEEEEKK